MTINIKINMDSTSDTTSMVDIISKTYDNKADIDNCLDNIINKHLYILEYNNNKYIIENTKDGPICNAIKGKKMILKYKENGEKKKISLINALRNDHILTKIEYNPKCTSRKTYNCYKMYDNQTTTNEITYDEVVNIINTIIPDNVDFYISWLVNLYTGKTYLNKPIWFYNICNEKIIHILIMLTIRSVINVVNYKYDCSNSTDLNFCNIFNKIVIMIYNPNDQTLCDVLKLINNSIHNIIIISTEVCKYDKIFKVITLKDCDVSNLVYKDVNISSFYNTLLNKCNEDLNDIDNNINVYKFKECYKSLNDENCKELEELEIFKNKCKQWYIDNGYYKDIEIPSSLIITKRYVKL